MTEQGIDIQCSWVNIESFDWLFSEFQPAQTIQVWPYGKRWFLPRWDFVDAQIRAIDSSAEKTSVDWSAGSYLKIEDRRFHARFLRWWWTKVRTPVRRFYIWKIRKGNA